MSPEPIRVGVLISKSGVAALTETTQLNGTLLALEELNEAGGVLGRRFEASLYDPASKPSRFRTYADRLLHEERVGFIFGCYMSSERKAVLPAIDQSDALLFYPTMYEGFEYCKNIIYSGATANQNNVPLVYYLMKNDRSRFYLIGSDYIFPRESSRIFSELVNSIGGEILAERFLPLTAGPEDFDRHIEEIRDLKPDAIFSTIVGQSVVHFYRKFAEAGFDPETLPIASLNTSEAEVMRMGPAAAHGHYLAAPYLETVDREENARFLRNYRTRYGAGAPITSCSEAAYFQVHLLAQAIEAAGTSDTNAVREALLGSSFEAPQGRVSIDPANNHTYLWSRIGRADEKGVYQVVEESEAPIKADPYLVLPSRQEWQRGMRLGSL